MKRDQIYGVPVSLMFLLLLNFGFANAQSLEAYAYIGIDMNMQAQLVFIEPTSVEYASNLNSTINLAGWYPPGIQSSASPNGEWILLVQFADNSAFQPEKALIRLINVLTGEVRIILQDDQVYFADRPLGFLGSDQNVVWSPDSQYLALNVSLGGEDLEILVYSISDGTLRNLTDDNVDQFRVGWSSDSSNIVTVTDYCTDLADNNSCSLSPNIYGVTEQFQQSIILSQLALGPADIGSTICELEWSPDNVWISFVSTCSSLLSLKPEKEVYLWNVELNSISQITNFTSEASQRTDVIEGVYRNAWFSETTLLIGASYILGPNQPEQTQTVAYNVNSGLTTFLSTNAAKGWAINPHTNLIAARLVAPITYSQIPLDSVSTSGEGDTTDTQEQVVTEQIARGSIRLFGLDEVHGLSTSASSSPLPNGCDLAWSPDGATLAFTIRMDDLCDAPVEHITFVNSINGTVLIHDLAAEQMQFQYVNIIGWVLQK